MRRECAKSRRAYPYQWTQERNSNSKIDGSKLSENIRPVVTIPLSEIDGNTDYEITGIWNLK